MPAVGFLAQFPESDPKAAFQHPYPTYQDPTIAASALSGACPYGACNDELPSTVRRSTSPTRTDLRLIRLCFRTFWTLSLTPSCRWLTFSNRRTPTTSRGLYPCPQEANSLLLFAMCSIISERDSGSLHATSMGWVGSAGCTVRRVMDTKRHHHTHPL
ncbi:hypothetical protein BKA70DRAFT_842244 [Coprinopsis sp. MPI-PUGE-AT-0042]|nr:hypothetical protein BKA70DRAFT_842244 [Coprinopsis sp. MPI-PUGE-AT-0042]